MLTYIPLENGRYILTQNRDESIMRPVATPPIKKRLGDLDVVYPVDPQGRGTWIGVSSEGRAAAILNGGSKKHQHKPPYRHSRGLIIPDFLRSPDFEKFYNGYDFSGLEPFTMLIFENGRIFEIIKEEKTLGYKELPATKPLFRLSYPLYPADSIDERSLAFYRWYYQQKDISPAQVFDYHYRDRYEMKHIPKYDTGRHILRTVSITQVQKGQNRFKMDYYDAVNDLHLFNSTPIHNIVNEHI